MTTLPILCLFIGWTFWHLIYRLTTSDNVLSIIGSSHRNSSETPERFCCSLVLCRRYFRPGSQAASRDDLMATAFIPKDYSRNLDLVFDCPASLVNLCHFFILFPWKLNDIELFCATSLSCGWRRTWQMWHWPWNVKSTVRKARSSPTQNWIIFLENWWPFTTSQLLML